MAADTVGSVKRFSYFLLQMPHGSQNHQLESPSLSRLCVCCVCCFGTLIFDFTTEWADLRQSTTEWVEVRRCSTNYDRVGRSSTKHRVDKHDRMGRSSTNTIHCAHVVPHAVSEFLKIQPGVAHNHRESRIKYVAL